ncbi:class I SAM-dependent methyltransferase [Thalassobacillus devorans]|uniref:class I SAM-dependent methyltransferase n=1 Tax=Thalassobacillus devorans TaxID=279813 RepID=UPI00048F945C|nr:class I SAM-dependent methyltransferase [Thalassobacillus devorans]
MNKKFAWHKEAERQWDDRVDFWNQNSKDMWDEGSRKTIIPFIQKHIAPDATIADIGCGDGYGSYRLHQAGYQVTGIDISPAMVERAKRQLKMGELTFIQGDLAGLDLDKESFDAIMAINCLEWTEVPSDGLKEMVRILRPGGKLCIGVLGPTAAPRKNSYRRLYGEDVICNTMMPWEFKTLAEEMGLKVIDGHGVYKRGVSDKRLKGLPVELQQALTFMWVFMLEKSLNKI